MSVRILLVEDEADVAEMYRLKLTMDGHQVHVARDGLEAVELVSKREFDLVLLDVEMPKLDGLAALERIRERPATRELPVLILSNSLSAGRPIQRARSMGILGWVVKSRTTPKNLGDAVRLWAIDQAREGTRARPRRRLKNEQPSSEGALKGVQSRQK